MIIKNEIKSNDIELLIYDVDGTIVEFKTLFDLLKESFEIHGIPFKNEYFAMYTKAVMSVLDKNSKSFNYDNLSSCLEKSLPILKSHNICGTKYLNTLLNLEYKYTHLCEGADDTIADLSDYFTQVISTNWFKSSQIMKINKYGLIGYFDNIFTCENFYPKPNKKHFTNILDLYGVDKRKTLVIGDSYSDVFASNYGLNSLLVDYNGNKRDIYEYSNIVVSELHDIKKLLLKK